MTAELGLFPGLFQLKRYTYPLVAIIPINYMRKFYKKCKSFRNMNVSHTYFEKAKDNKD